MLPDPSRHGMLQNNTAHVHRFTMQWMGDKNKLRIQQLIKESQCGECCKVIDLRVFSPCPSRIKPNVLLVQEVATISCKDCSENYCSECHESVHKRGRRKQHTHFVVILVCKQCNVCILCLQPSLSGGYPAPGLVGELTLLPDAVSAASQSCNSLGHFCAAHLSMLAQAQHATKECLECKSRFCDACCADVHSSGAKKAHRCVPRKYLVR